MSKKELMVAIRKLADELGRRVSHPFALFAKGWDSIVRKKAPVKQLPL